jgi:hypothetical protein
MLLHLEAAATGTSVALENTGAVEVTIHAADLENAVLGRRTLSPRVTVGPVVDQPEALSGRNVDSNGLDKLGVNVERGLARDPINSVLVVSGSGIDGCSDRVRRGRAVGAGLLVGQVNDGGVGGQEGEINLLSVVGVEGETVSGSGDVGDLGHGADGSVKDVIVGRGDLGRRDGTLGLTTGYGQGEGRVLGGDTNVDQIETARKGGVAGTDSVDGRNNILDETGTVGGKIKGIVPSVAHLGGEETDTGDIVVTTISALNSGSGSSGGRCSSEKAAAKEAAELGVGNSSHGSDGHDIESVVLDGRHFENVVGVGCVLDNE